MWSTKTWGQHLTTPRPHTQAGALGEQQALKAVLHEARQGLLKSRSQIEAQRQFLKAQQEGSLAKPRLS